MRRIGLHAFLLAVVVTTVPAAAQVPGTYRLTICTRPCTESDSGVVRGRLVLFYDAIRVDTLSQSLRTALSERIRLRATGPESVNACFALPTGPAHVAGRELYAGIIRRGLTRWDVSGSDINVMLYRSPDAWYELVGRFESRGYVGRGEQVNCCGGDPPSTFFLARRVGPPDINSCMQEAS